MYRRAPLYVDRVLKGTSPADLPVEQPAKVELLVNLQSAKTLGIEVPLSLLIRADELLEWIEGRTIRIEYRWGDGRADRLPQIAAEFVRLKVDVIVTTGTPVPVFKEATSTIPIV